MEKIYDINICKDKSPYHFIFAALTYDQVEKPTIQNILEMNFMELAIGKPNFVDI